jgi:hypothetical protein
VGVDLEAKPRARTFTLKHQVVTDFTAGVARAASKHS